MPEQDDGDRNAWRLFGVYSGLAMTAPAAALVGYLVGAYLDGHFHTVHLFTIIFVLLGCAAGLYEILRVASRS